MKKFGARLREIRESKGISQEGLANEAGFPPSQIGRIERGELNTSISHVYALSKALNVHITNLFEF